MLRNLPSRLSGGLVAVSFALVAQAPAQTLAEAVDTRSSANQEGVKSQQKIDKVADETDSLLSEYRSTLKQIEALRIYNQQMVELISFQDEEMASLRAQVDDVEIVGRGVTPLMLSMIDALEAFVGLDMPFLGEERAERVARLREIMGRADVTNSEKYRRIMEAFQIENDYGRTIEAYRGTIETGQTVDFLRVGRVALVYQTLDGAEAGAWDMASRSWSPLDSSYRTSIKEGLRIARKQSAPDMIRLPLPAAQSAGGQG